MYKLKLAEKFSYMFFIGIKLIYITMFGLKPESALFLFFVITPTIFPQETENVTPNEFCAFDWHNWIDKIVYETKISEDTTFKIIHYEINFNILLGPAFIESKANSNFKVDIQDLSTITLQLSNEFVVDSITGNVMPYKFTSDSVNITLDRNYNIGDEVNITLYFSGVPPVLINNKGMRFVKHGNNEPVIPTLSTRYHVPLWFPCKDDPFEVKFF